jgi:hypothetical protein
MTSTTTSSAPGGYADIMVLDEPELPSAVDTNLFLGLFVHRLCNNILVGVCDD